MVLATHTDETAQGKEALLRSVRAAGEPCYLLETIDSGASAVVMARGARVLSLFDARGTNFLWVPPALYTPAAAGQLLRSPEWCNIGGDRTWIGPEIDTRIPDLADPWGTIITPKAFDPGAYSIQVDGSVATWQTQGRLASFRSNTICEFAVHKRVRMVGSPLRRHPEADAWERILSFAGYEQTTTLQLFSSPSGVRLCLWSLTVLPGGGDLVVPTLYTAQTRDFMEPTGQSHLSISEDLVRFRLDGLERHKIGIKPEPLTGRMGYVRPVAEDQWALVVRNFAVDPSAEYVDVPWDAPQDMGYAVEIYNDGNDRFGEMEYHAPAVGGDSGMDAYVDHSQLWAFCGPREVIRSVGRYLLGVDISLRQWPSATVHL